MTTNFLLSDFNYKLVNEFPDFWTKSDFSELLTALELEEMISDSDSEMLEVTTMALQDLSIDPAIELVLQTRFGEEFDQGKIQDLVQRCQADELWEEYSDLSRHRDFFCIGWLLNKAFPGSCSKPRTGRLTFKLKPEKEQSSSTFEAEASSAFLLSAASQAMPENSLINRLYGEHLDQETFTDADKIIWHSSVQSLEETGIFEVSLYTGREWLEDILEGEQEKVLFKSKLW